MKKLVFYVMLITLISCNTNKLTGIKAAGVGEEWKISEDVARGMINRLNECGLFKPCHNESKVTDSNRAELQWLKATYPTAEIINVDARYRHQDQERYATLRGITDEKKAKVRGYKTQIVKVVLTTGSMFASEYYYDCYTIKPPPPDDQ
ncbi:MAG TPA: hypothetical protein VGP43_05285 [Chitinophagaceae bacterium]|nr:hypothetical protein [Chitinophagaceae bacterium]